MPVPVEDARVPARILRAGFAVMGVGVALHDLAYDEGPLLSTLWLDLGWREGSAVFAHRAGAWLCLAAGLAVLASRRAWPLLVLAGGWMGLRTAASIHQGEIHPELEAPAAALRWLGPLATAALLSGWRLGRVPGGRWRTGVTALRWAAAATFAAHGLEAWLLYPPFQDLLTMAGRNLLGVELATATNHALLRAIAVVDLVVAVLVVTARWTAVALWMALWGLVTATARVVHSGADGLGEALVRAPHVAAPLALAAIWRLRNAAPVLDWTAGPAVGAAGRRG